MNKDDKKKAPSLNGAFCGEVWFLECTPDRTRTYNQWLKRPLLYQLSYGCMVKRIVCLNL